MLDEVFFPVCSPNFRGGQLPRTPADLADAPLLRSHDELWKPWFDAAGLVDFPEPKRGVLYEDSSNLLQAAIQGQGIALVRRSLAMHEIVAGRLVRLFNIDGPSPWNYYFVCPPALLGTQRVQDFRTWLFDEIARFKQLYECTPAACDAPAAPLAPQVVAIGGLVVASLGYLIALANTPAATNNIYDQQYQMHRFAVDYYRRPVAVNDLGWVAFRNTNYILDLGGLASREALLARASESNPDWMRRLAAEHGVHLAMIYDEWFAQKPPGWVRVGQLKFNQLRVTAADSKVSFYATDADSVAGIRAALLQ